MYMKGKAAEGNRKLWLINLADCRDDPVILEHKA